MRFPSKFYVDFEKINLIKEQKIRANPLYTVFSFALKMKLYQTLVVPSRGVYLILPNTTSIVNSVKLKYFKKNFKEHIHISNTQRDEKREKQESDILVKMLTNFIGGSSQ